MSIVFRDEFSGIGKLDFGSYGGGTFVKVPPHPLKTFEFGEGWLF